MFLQFKVSNFRSIGEEQVLSLLPEANQEEFQENILAHDGYSALKMAALYGANGSGKSNVLKAIGEFISMVKDTAHAVFSDTLEFDPFLLREGWEEKPTEFEMMFSLQEHRYRYGFSFNATHILKEYLFRQTRGGEVGVFEREGDTINAGSSLKATAKMISSAIKKTKSNSLFLGNLYLLKVAEANVIFEFFNRNIMIDGLKSFNFGELESICESSEVKIQVSQHLKRLKAGLLNVEAQVYGAVATHKFYDKEGNATEKTVSWDFFERESSGANEVLEFSVPINVILQLGGVLIIDELEAKLHPLITLDTINLFLNKETNPNNAQLIFSTHDTNLLSYARLRRDQIYFVEKNSWESTEIYSLADVNSVNDHESAKSTETQDMEKEKRYFEGRYGAIPVFDFR
ncbi:AAA family ATPase [Pedobacter sp. MR2016-24]|uniref:AAA family ATPase n=1 Tax=Pedobacter sp. MR2016-24 TaxID=2994466 RepID=UPI0022477B3B|nr:ATP-binding protein [Pedobacter sp. MR2016-24]MCX2483798.1 AAA family ATPase [Pedobacter sp. MR2016-24]